MTEYDFLGELRAVSERLETAINRFEDAGNSLMAGVLWSAKMLVDRVIGLAV
jgi:hypothetical protein